MTGCPCFQTYDAKAAVRMTLGFMNAAAFQALPDQAASMSMNRRQLAQDNIYSSTIYSDTVGLGWSIDGLSLDPKRLQVPGAGLNNSTAICLTLPPRVICQRQS